MNKPSLTQMMAEWNVTYQTRLGMLCEDREPTPEQDLMAHEEADRAVLAMQQLPKKARYQTDMGATWAAKATKED